MVFTLSFGVEVSSASVLARMNLCRLGRLGCGWNNPEKSTAGAVEWASGDRLFILIVRGCNAPILLRLNKAWLAYFSAIYPVIFFTLFDLPFWRIIFCKKFIWTQEGFFYSLFRPKVSIELFPHTNCSSNKKEDQMRLITRFELATRTDDELHALLRQVFNAVAMAQPNSFEQVQATASLQNIQNELTSRTLRLWGLI